MKCLNCGAENPDFAVYCSQCGAKFENSEKQPPEQSTPQASFQPPLPRGNGVLILIFGIIGLVSCMPLGIAAWLMGNNDLQKMRQGFLSRDEEGITQAGRILGIIATIIFILIAGVVIIGLLFAVGFGGHPESWNFLL